MPAIPFIAAAATVGGSIYAADKASSANDKAIAAQTAANDESNKLQKQAFDTITANNAPFMQAGTGALAQLSQQFGLGTYTPSYVGAGSPANQNAPQYDVGAYISQNPDVQARAQELTNSGVIGPNGQWKSVEDWVGQVQLPNAQAAGEQRAYPTLAQTPVDPATQPGTGQNYGPEVGPRETYTRPGMPDLSGEAYQKSPGYENRLKEAGRTTNAQFGAKGLLQSGAAATEFGRRMQGIADEDFTRWQDREIGLYNIGNQNFNSDRQYGTGVYDADRNYLTNRFDQNVGDLFRLTGIGQNAASNQGSAASNYASNAGNLAQNNANNLSSAYGNQANIAGGLAGNIVGAGQNLLANYGSGGGGYSTPGSYGVSTLGTTPDATFNGLY